MQISSKCSYALQAIFVLSERTDPGPLKIAEIAERQRIPLKFLEAILNQLKGGGFVRSQRGVDGGYRLARSADHITVGEVLRFIDGPLSPIEDANTSPFLASDLPGAAAFLDFWEQVDRALSGVVDHTTFADLVRRDVSQREQEEPYVANWSI